MTPSARKAFEDGREWFVRGVVALHEGETSHYAVMAEGHIMVSVISTRHHQEIWAILRGGDDDGAGVWHIPSIGTEVLIGFDCGDFEGDAYVVAVVGRVGAIPVAPGVIVVVGPTQVIVQSPDVEIRAEGGVAASLAKVAGVLTLQEHFYRHGHMEHDTFPTGGPVDPDAFNGPFVPEADVQGTDVLTAE